MSQNVEKVSVKTPIPELAESMLKTGFNGYPVVSDADQVVGIVTQTDLLKLIYELETQ